ncbi:hypothetical protein M0813_05206 [Anaeramoeba flamelloides]|uniref:Heparan-alpha-glucosaminide N-acetyltransferase catalytic domain-containing protein n=1 Tax=Anaeramoeba flamelloides TaxID=1746091 RepID=A0ABQ8XHX4_9EUKA|nr:hypothetical protein M0813_05206 [Anaeramoeba flamelloides]
MSTNEHKSLLQKNKVSKASYRLISVDVLRGMFLFIMTFVNNSGDKWTDHGPWNGFRLADVVMPGFLFTVGFSIVLSFTRLLSRGVPRKQLVKKVLIRTLKLIGLGLFLAGHIPYYNFKTLRLPGVLQRIAIAYLIGSLTVLLMPVFSFTWFSQTKNRFLLHLRVLCQYSLWWLIGISIQIIYLCVTFLSKIGGCPRGSIEADCNVAAHIDRAILTTNHMYSRPTCLELEKNPCKFFDPEGIFTTVFGAPGSVFFGIYFGIIWVHALNGDLNARKKKLGSSSDSILNSSSPPSSFSSSSENNTKTNNNKTSIQEKEKYQKNQNEESSISFSDQSSKSNGSNELNISNKKEKKNLFSSSGNSDQDKTQPLKNLKPPRSQSIFQTLSTSLDVLNLNFKYINVRFSTKDLILHWLIVSLFCLIFGIVLHFTVFPINKNLYSTSYISLNVGISGCVLCVLYLGIEYFWKFRYQNQPNKRPIWVLPFVSLGMNSIFVFIADPMLQISLGIRGGDWAYFFYGDQKKSFNTLIWKHLLLSWMSENTAKIIWGLCDSITFSIITTILYKKKIFFKV